MTNEGQPHQNETPPPLKPEYQGADRRQNREVRAAVGEDKVLTEEQRTNMLTRLAKGLFTFRKNTGLRRALGGEEHILDEQQRISTLQAIKEAIQKFFKAGIDRAKEDDTLTPKKSFVDRLRGEKQEPQRHREGFKHHK